MCCCFLRSQITVNSYIANLAAVLSAPNIIFHGPLSIQDLAKSEVCVPGFSQQELDYAKANPTAVVDARTGIEWGKRILASVGTVYASIIGLPAATAHAMKHRTHAAHACCWLVRRSPNASDSSIQSQRIADIASTLSEALRRRRPRVFLLIRNACPTVPLFGKFVRLFGNTRLFAKYVQFETCFPLQAQRSRGIRARKACWTGCICARTC